MNSDPLLPVAAAEPNLDDADQYLVMHVDVYRFAVPLRQVREVVRAVWAESVPDAPAIVTGVIDLRGRWIPLVDLRVRFGIPTTPVQTIEMFVIAWTGDRTVALRADRVDWFATVSQQETDSVDDVLRRGLPVSGLARTDDGLLLLQDLREFMQEAEARALDTAVAAFVSNRTTAS